MCVLGCAGLTRSGVVIRSLEAGDSIHNSERTQAKRGREIRKDGKPCVTSVTVIMLEKVFRQAAPSFK